MWIGEARTRIDPSHPDSLSLSLPVARCWLLLPLPVLLPVKPARTPTKQKRPVPPFRPFSPPSVSFAPLLRNNTPTYIYLYWIDRTCDPVEEISETNR